MKRIIPGTKIFAIIAAAMIVMGACGTTAEGTNDNVPEATEQTQEANDEPDVETEDEKTVDVDTEEEPIEESVEELSTVSVDQIIDLVEAQAAGHIHIPKEEILAVALSFNWDYITDEDKDVIMETYGVSLEDLDGYFRSFIDRDAEMFNKYGAYYYGMYNSIEPEYDMNNWIQYPDFAFEPEDIELANSIGNVVDDYHTAANIDKENSNFNYTLYYVNLPNFALDDEYKMEYTVFMRPAAN